MVTSGCLLLQGQTDTECVNTEAALCLQLMLMSVVDDSICGSPWQSTCMNVGGGVSEGAVKGGACLQIATVVNLLSPTPPVMVKYLFLMISVTLVSGFRI